MQNNTQASQAGQQADDIIKQLATPSEQIEVGKEATPVDVLDKAKPINDDWKARYSGYKASTDTTIHTLRNKVKEFDLVQTENDSLREQLETAKYQTPAQPDGMADLFSQEELDGINKMVEGRVDVLQNKVDTLQDNAKIQDARTKEQEANEKHYAIVDAVAKSVPNYNEIDVDPGFRTYMNEPDSYGNVRVDLLEIAKNATPPDVGRIVQFYVDYNALNENSNTNRSTYTEQELLQTPHSQSSGTVTPQQQGSGVQWNQATVNQFYKDKATGKIGPKEAAALEQELYAALGNRGR